MKLKLKVKLPPQQTEAGGLAANVHALSVKRDREEADPGHSTHKKARVLAADDPHEHATPPALDVPSKSVKKPSGLKIKLPVGIGRPVDPVIAPHPVNAALVDASISSDIVGRQAAVQVGEAPVGTSSAPYQSLHAEDADQSGRLAQEAQGGAGPSCGGGAAAGPADRLPSSGPATTSDVPPGLAGAKPKVPGRIKLKLGGSTMMRIAAAAAANAAPPSAPLGLSSAASLSLFGKAKAGTGSAPGETAIIEPDGVGASGTPGGTAAAGVNTPQGDGAAVPAGSAPLSATAVAAAGLAKASDVPSLAQHALDTQAATRAELEGVLGKVQKKDVHGWFKDPVTEALAPGYFGIISQPMDFSTMRKKMSAGQYSTWGHLAGDLDLIFSNCMKYNNAESPFHKQAKFLSLLSAKLVHLGRQGVRNLRGRVAGMVRRENALMMQEEKQARDSELVLEGRRRPILRPAEGAAAEAAKALAPVSAPAVVRKTWAAASSWKAAAAAAYRNTQDLDLRHTFRQRAQATVNPHCLWGGLAGGATAEGASFGAGRPSLRCLMSAALPSDAYVRSAARFVSRCGYSTRRAATARLVDCVVPAVPRPRPVPGSAAASSEAQAVLAAANAAAAALPRTTALPSQHAPTPPLVTPPPGVGAPAPAAPTPNASAGTNMASGMFPFALPPGAPLPTAVNPAQAHDYASKVGAALAAWGGNGNSLATWHAAVMATAHQQLLQQQQQQQQQHALPGFNLGAGMSTSLPQPLGGGTLGMAPGPSGVGAAALPPTLQPGGMALPNVRMPGLAPNLPPNWLQAAYAAQLPQQSTGVQPLR